MLSRRGGSDVTDPPSVHVLGAFRCIRESGRSTRRGAFFHTSLTERNLDILSSPLATIVTVIGSIQWFRHGTRHRAMTEEKDHCIVAAAVGDHFLSTREICEHLGSDAADATVRRRLRIAGLIGGMAALKPLLAASNKKARLPVVSEHASRKSNVSGQLDFSGETTFTTRQDQLVRAEGYMRIPRLKSVFFCSKDPAYVQRVIHNGRTRVNVWGADSKCGLGSLHRIIGRLTYSRDDVDTILIPFVHSGLFFDHNVWFQHDLAPVHTARVVEDHLQRSGI
ncbi:hypothetical protein HPB47_018047 [Ixodes persulcatus]|uniref:Uncharacterized protein n=1 Tax=Ixodes persulcatus TaxID=34615 RepID=A0AC60QQE4_IXOPE|nr:hypothetical protein HPB47_018047 [Ixodes persulcatus]